MDISDLIVAIVAALSGAGAVTGGRAWSARSSKNGGADRSRSNESIVDRELRRREDGIRREAQLEVAVLNLTKSLDDLVKETSDLRQRVHKLSSKEQEHEHRITVLERDNTTGPHRTVDS